MFAKKSSPIQQQTLGAAETSEYMTAMFLSSFANPKGPRKSHFRQSWDKLGALGLVRGLSTKHGSFSLKALLKGTLSKAVSIRDETSDNIPTVY